MNRLLKEGPLVLNGKSFQKQEAMAISEHKTSHKGPFLSFRFVMIGQYLKILNLRVQNFLNIKKIIFKVVKIKFLAMHINNKKIRLDIFTVGISS